MAGYISDDTRKVTTHRLVEMKQRGEKISMLTSYDYTMAQIVDGAGMDVILVGDSASNVMAGNVTTLPITLDQMIYHAKSVVRGVKRAMVVVDMPFGSYQGNEMEGLASAIRIMKESHADALKLEGGEEIIQDMLGMNNGFRPRFLRRYADLHTVMTDAISRYVSDVKNLDFPNEKEQY